jgi:quercetin dioxygenase-like cupin family protein
MIRSTLVLVCLFVSVLPLLAHGPEQNAQQKSAPLPPGDVNTYRPGNMSIDQIRKIGTIPNLNQGIEIPINGLRTRLIAWPGQGMVNGAIHLITLAPGDATLLYRYPVSEEALECIKGKGEVYYPHLDRWVTIEPGDVAYFPENVKHGIRNREKSGDFVLISQITPPQLDLYEESKLFVRSTGKFDSNRIAQLTASSPRGNLTAITDAKYRNTHPEVRAWNRSNDKIRREGALFNIFYGAPFTQIGVPMLIILFPGYGTRSAGLHTGILPKGGAGAHSHTHPISDDCVIYLQGKASVSMEGKDVPVGALDVIAAPILVPHGAGGATAEQALLSGYGAPPQQELYEQEGYLKGGVYTRPNFVKLEDVVKSQSAGGQ